MAKNWNKLICYALLVVVMAGCKGLQLNLPVTVKTGGPTVKRDFWVFLNDNPSDYNQGGSTGWHRYPIRVGSAMILSAWVKENGTFSPTRFGKWRILKGDKRLISIMPIGDGHTVQIAGLARGKIGDIAFYDIDGNRIHVFDVTIE